MPGVLVEEPLDPSHTPSMPPLSSPPQHPALSQLSPLLHYIPVLTRSNYCDTELPPQLSPLRRPPGICLNLNALPDMYAEDGTLHDSELNFMQLSPASAVQFGHNGVSPTTLSTVSALRRFLPSNFDKDDIDDALHFDMYSGDEFRMYEFKVRRCMRGRSHDWTECPFAHPGEKARRRDPRRYHYSGSPCADYKKGSCKKGDACDLAHGVFECWLHPTRYRTQPCKDGRGCRRRICFFAHTPDQLRHVSPTSSSPCTSPSPTFMSACVDNPLEGYDLSSSFAPTDHCTSVKGSLSESLPAPSLPMPRSATAEAFTASSLSPRSLSFDIFPPVSPISSPHEVPFELSSHNGLSTFKLPERCQSLRFNHSQAMSMPTHNRMLSERQSSLGSLTIPSLSNGLKSAGPSPSSSSLSAAMRSSQKIEDLVRLLKQLDLAQQQEPVWHEGKGSMVFAEQSLLRQCAQSVPVTPTNTRCKASRDNMMSNGVFFDEEEDSGEPRLERVESGKGLRAQIFESLLSSTTASGS